MKTKRRVLAVMCAAVLVMGLSACGGSGSETQADTTAAGSQEETTTASGTVAAEYTLNISVDASEEETIYKYAAKFGEELEFLSGGKLKAVVYGNGTLGGDSEALQSCADGSLAFVLSTTAPQVSIMPELAMFDLPNLFDDISQFRSLFDNEAFYQKLTDIYQQGGFQLLGIADSGFRVMSSNVKVEALSNMTGIKIRTMQNSNHIAIWQAYGANPTPMSFSEVYIGLQQGTIDAQENPIEVLVSSKFYEQQKHVILTNHLTHACVLLMSGAVYTDLPAEYQEMVVQAAETATQYTRDLSDTQTAEQLAFLEKQGTEVIPLSDEIRGQLREAAQSVYQMIGEQIGQELMDLMLEAAGK